MGTFAELAFLGSVTDVSIFAINLTTALGLGLGIDYALFMVSRFREQLAAGDGAAASESARQLAACAARHPSHYLTAVAALARGRVCLATGDGDAHACLREALTAFARAKMPMEVAASRVLRPLLGPGELSVGVTVDVAHTAATQQGVRVKATARYLGREGKLFVFEVVARDRGGEIGRGTHKRAIISAERLLAGAERRNRKV